MKSRVKADTTRFANPSTEEEAYWLGFLFTDGSIQGTKIAVSLAERDAGHLTKLYAFFGSLRRPHHRVQNRVAPNAVVRTKQAYATFTLTSFVVAEHLIRLGFHERKTWSIKPWDGPPELMRHFWRGCIDGDGSIHECSVKSEAADRPPHKVWNLHFCGNEAMVRGFANFATPVGGPARVFAVRTNCHGQTLYAVRWHEKAAAEIVSLLYGGTTVFLDRKREAAEALLLCRQTRKGVAVRHCSTPGCARPYAAKGFCNSCWRRQYRADGRDSARLTRKSCS